MGGLCGLPAAVRPYFTCYLRDNLSVSTGRAVNRLIYSHEARAVVIVTFTNTLNVLVLFHLAQIDAFQLAALTTWLSSVITLCGYALAKTDGTQQTPPTTVDSNFEGKG